MSFRSEQYFHENRSAATEFFPIPRNMVSGRADAPELEKSGLFGAFFIDKSHGSVYIKTNMNGVGIL